jgi:predicted transposase YbfD/YdcC
MSIDVFTHHFSSINDPRQTAKVSYLLFDGLFLTVCAVIAGWEDIEDFGTARLEWLKKYGSFENGIPVHDTIARLISRIEPADRQSGFIGWMNTISTSTAGDVAAIFGKTLRGSYNRHDRQSTIHMVSAFATANGVVMGQLKTEAKSNEITLALLEIKGCLVTIDAMGCQTKIAKSIINKGANYLLAVKGNQETLFAAIKDALSPPNHKEQRYRAYYDRTRPWSAGVS